MKILYFNNKMNIFFYRNIRLHLSVVIFNWIFFYSIFSNKIYSQEKIENKYKYSLKFAVGFGKYKLRDKVFSPLRYGGTSVPISLQFKSNRNKKLIHNISFFYDNFEASSSITRKYDWSANYVNAFSGELNYTIAKKMKPSFAKWFSNVYVGLGWKNFFSLKQYQITKNNSQGSVDFISSLNFCLNMEKKLNRRSFLLFNVRYAFFAYVWGRVRHPLDIPNLIDVDEVNNFSNDNDIGLGGISVGDALRTGDFLTLNRLIQLETQLEYKYSFSKRIDFVATYHFRFYQYKKFSLTSVGNSNLLTGIIFKL